MKAPSINTTATHLASEIEYRILEDVNINFTKSQAQQFLECESFQGERAIREGHVQFLMDEWRSGRFLWHLVNIASAKLGEKFYRINGQHTSWMRFLIPSEVDPPKCVVRKITYGVDTLDQVRDIYSAYDRNAPRTHGHILKNLLYDRACTNGIPQAYVNIVSAGIRFWQIPDKHAKPTPAELAALISTNYPVLYNTVGRFLVAHYQDASWVRRQSVLAAMFATFEKAPTKSPEFWAPVCSGLGMNDPKDARYQLRRFLESHGHTLGSVTPISQEEMYRVCIQAWNRWRKGESVSVLKSTDKRMKPI